jgi:multisubunit Na+/H+ antiporter MnhE subunit
VQGASCRYGVPGRVLEGLTLPADSLLPGTVPAQEAGCPAARTSTGPRAEDDAALLTSVCRRARRALTGLMPQRARQAPARRRAAAWAGWWVVLMSFWMILDDSVAVAELLAGAAAAALGASFAELVTYRASSRFRLRARWLLPALRLPAQVARDTVIVFAALWRRLARGEEPASRFRELPVRYGDDSAEGITRRVLLIGARSLAPNSFALGLDAERGVLVVHELVPAREDPG